MKLLENSRARGFTQASQYHCTEREREKCLFHCRQLLGSARARKLFSQTKKKSLFQKKRCGAEKGPFAACVCVKAEHLRPENMQRCVFEVRSHISGQGFGFLLPWISRTVPAVYTRLVLTA